MGSHGTGAGLPDDVRESLDAFRRIVQALRTSAVESERRVGLSAAQLFALQQLAHAPGASVNELAARTFTHQSSVSVVVRRLVERRLVVKVVSRDDRRRVRLALSDTGRALLRRSPEPVQERLVAAIAALPDEQRRTLGTVLAELARTIGDADGHAPMFFEEKTKVRTRRARPEPTPRSRKTRRTRR